MNKTMLDTSPQANKEALSRLTNSNTFLAIIILLALYLVRSFGVLPSTGPYYGGLFSGFITQIVFTLVASVIISGIVINRMLKRMNAVADTSIIYRFIFIFLIFDIVIASIASIFGFGFGMAGGKNILLPSLFFGVSLYFVSLIIIPLKRFSLKRLYKGKLSKQSMTNIALLSNLIIIAISVYFIFSVHYKNCC